MLLLWHQAYASMEHGYLSTLILKHLKAARVARQQLPNVLGRITQALERPQSLSLAFLQSPSRKLAADLDELLETLIVLNGVQAALEQVETGSVGPVAMFVATSGLTEDLKQLLK